MHASLGPADWPERRTRAPPHATAQFWTLRPYRPVAEPACRITVKVEARASCSRVGSGQRRAAPGCTWASPDCNIKCSFDNLTMGRDGQTMRPLRTSCYTASGSVAESKGLKHRPEGSIREVPLAPELVSRLRLHLEQFEPVDGRVLSTRTGHPIAAANYGQVWIRARAHLWPPGHPLARATVYDLRHAAATTMLLAGLSPAEVARRLGHSVDVLMRVYAGVFNDERGRSNQQLDDFLAVTGARARAGSPTGHPQREMCARYPDHRTLWVPR